MTRGEAILLLHDMKDTYDEIHENTNGDIGYEQMTALDMAIEALSADADCSTCKHKDKDWDSEECDSCCGNNNHYASAEAGWIPCSERLPEKDDLVLVTVWNDVTIAWRNIYGGWESAEDMYEKGDVIAWMPLPSPYREDGEA